jgi:hypothetical protein
MAISEVWIQGVWYAYRSERTREWVIWSLRCLFCDEFYARTKGPFAKFIIDGFQKH